MALNLNLHSSQDSTVNLRIRNYVHHGNLPESFIHCLIINPLFISISWNCWSSERLDTLGIP